MAILSLKNQKLWVDGYDLSTRISSMALDTGVEELDSTAFGATARGRTAGLRTAAFNHEGFVEYGVDLVDAVLFARLAQNNVAMTIGMETGADGEIAYSAQMLELQYSPGATVGEMMAFSVSGSGNGPAVRGTIMHNATRTTSSNGVDRQLGAVAQGKKLYAALHVIAASGTTPTLDVIVRSDNASGMPSPITQITFAQATGISGQWAAPVAGPITDDWWDVSWTIAGTTPSFTFIVVVGIL